jgi:hypothetical protein
MILLDRVVRPLHLVVTRGDEGCNLNGFDKCILF